MPSPDACEQCVATLSRNEQKNARRDGAMARWRDGTMARWHDGTMARWHDGTMARWHDGTMARWHDGTMARWADSKAVLRPCPFSRKKKKKWQRFAVVNDGFANVSESENSDLVYRAIDRSTRQIEAQRPFTSANLTIFPHLRHDFSSQNGHSIKLDASHAQRQNQTILPLRAFDGSTPNGGPRQTKTQRRRLEKSLGRDSKPPESQLPYNRQPPPRQRSSKVARAP